MIVIKWFFRDRVFCGFDWKSRDLFPVFQKKGPMGPSSIHQSIQWSRFCMKLAALSYRRQILFGFRDILYIHAKSDGMINVFFFKGYIEVHVFGRGSNKGTQKMCGWVHKAKNYPNLRIGSYITTLHPGWFSRETLGQRFSPLNWMIFCSSYTNHHLRSYSPVTQV